MGIICNWSICRFSFSSNLPTKIAKQPKSEWEKEDYNAENDLFISHFNENGNFVEKTSEESDNQDTTYNYIYKET